MQSRLRIVNNRDPLGRALRARYLLVEQFPSGRQIIKRKASNRAGAFSAARVVSAPQTSPTAAGGGVNYDPTATYNQYISGWQINSWDFPIF